MMTAYDYGKCHNEDQYNDTNTVFLTRYFFNLYSMNGLLHLCYTTFPLHQIRSDLKNRHALLREVAY